jgi:hypothetical protein
MHRSSVFCDCKGAKATRIKPYEDAIAKIAEAVEVTQADKEFLDRVTLEWAMGNESVALAMVARYRRSAVNVDVINAITEEVTRLND